jgi:hypothetical protein
MTDTQPDPDGTTDRWLSTPRRRSPKKRSVARRLAPPPDDNGLSRPRLHAEFRVRVILSTQRVLVVTCASYGDAYLLATHFDDARIEQRMVGPWTTVKPDVTTPGNDDRQAPH